MKVTTTLNSNKMVQKEEVIKEAWIKTIGKDNFNSITIDEDGFLNFETTKEYHFWINTYPCKFVSKNYNPFKKGEDCHIQNVSIRPKSLQGIEKNNGWIKIESEKDLPKENCDVFAYINNRIERRRFQSDIPHLWINKAITHYIIIELPQPPIY